MRKLVILSFIVLLYNACGINTLIDIKQVKPLEVNKQYTYNHIPYKSIDEHRKPDSINPATENFYYLFGINKAQFTNLVFKLTADKKLAINFIDSNGVTKTNTYKGKFTHKGIFYVKQIRKNISIPFVYTQRDLEKYRFVQSSTGELLLYYKNIREGALLFFGSGLTYARLYYFKAL